MRGDDHHAAAIAVDAVKDLAPPDGRAVPYLTMRAFIVGGSNNNARPAKSRPATDTRGGRACRPGGGGSVSSCLRFSPEPVIGGATREPRPGRWSSAK